MVEDELCNDRSVQRMNTIIHFLTNLIKLVLKTSWVRSKVATDIETQKEMTNLSERQTPEYDGRLIYPTREK
jgi:hypothetical protein